MTLSYDVFKVQELYASSATTHFHVLVMAADQEI